MEIHYIPPRHQKAARDVPVGASWAFRDHRNMAQVMAEEAALIKLRDVAAPAHLRIAASERKTGNLVNVERCRQSQSDVAGPRILHGHNPNLSESHIPVVRQPGASVAGHDGKMNEASERLPMFRQSSESARLVDDLADGQALFLGTVDLIGDQDARGFREAITPTSIDQEREMVLSHARSLAAAPRRSNAKGAVQ